MVDQHGIAPEDWRSGREKLPARTLAIGLIWLVPVFGATFLMLAHANKPGATFTLELSCQSKERSA
jgi:hypothetical protein